MDEVFWSNVVKRWSEATDTVIRLRKELSKVQEERELYRDVVQSLRKSGGGSGLREPSGSRLFGHARDESAGTLVVDEEHAHASSALQDELKDAEAGLGRAKEEYRRLQKELTGSNEKVRILTLEKERLLAIQIEPTPEMREERSRMEKLQKELRDVHSENHNLIGKVLELEQELTRLRSTQEPSSEELTPKIPVIQGSSSNSLERQIEQLKEVVENGETDKDDLRIDLRETQEKLRKAEESNKSLMKSIMKLQDITRHSTGTLQAISANLLSGSPRSRRLSLASSTHSKPAETSRKVSSSSGPAETHTHVEDITVIDSHPASVQSLGGSLPTERETALAKLPVVQSKEVDPNNLFERDFLKTVLGALTERPSEKHGVVEGKIITSSYLCPTLNHHPWCPLSPGQHGYVFIGLGKEKESYKAPTIRNLFVGLPKEQARHRRFRYLGKYRAMRVRSLNVDEWNTLPEEVKLVYAKLTKDKTRDSRTPEEILAAYDHGDLLVPCVLLQCISFDEQLYETLISQRNTEQQG